MGYLIHRAGRTPALDAGFDSGEWSGCRTLNVDVFRPEGSGHRPETRFRLQYDREGLYGLFSVRDRFVRCVARKFQDPVCRDSCVEFFVRPAHGRGYVNFEFSAAGVLLAQHVADCRRRPGTDDVRPLTEREAAGIRIYHSLPGRIEQELAQETCYELGFFLPFSIFAGTHGAPAPVSRTVWSGNVYKCGDDTSHPHWASWRPVRRVNFHEPDCFGDLEFE
ncbi:hypothetical protein FYJ85_08095 [Victivallaceae bacterium BBE-744-WT-12]|uniref:Carbohydrate-binding domain-containing protein n=1 Tax=Victivallis lenta TaxID=2606640 RepID=A0A844G294_9BACT|nr:carbohydrate-binding family 9-like protein [Victivallis lenta]AVM45184.1 hypothetical protein C5Q97_10925 [Victivallales bacterium CCUG 44730]MBS1455072.1 carbohydrate-binding family 9-like protein [Lentisphaeria bacterium]MBS5530060.1 carbohydrate-binding family 9-like protein [bacterium]MST97005.1 hypothetical protein [Victivallis lenta]HBP08360.1 hypothetical protein [Lentisphaeria bacterium]